MLMTQLIFMCRFKNSKNQLVNSLWFALEIPDRSSSSPLPSSQLFGATYVCPTYSLFSIFHIPYVYTNSSYFNSIHYFNSIQPSLFWFSSSSFSFYVHFHSYSYCFCFLSSSSHSQTFSVYFLSSCPLPTLHQYYFTHIRFLFYLFFVTPLDHSPI